jgi:hypothetical protein
MIIPQVGATIRTEIPFTSLCFLEYFQQFFSSFNFHCFVITHDIDSSSTTSIGLSANGTILFVTILHLIAYTNVIGVWCVTVKFKRNFSAAATTLEQHDC